MKIRIIFFSITLLTFLNNCGDISVSPDLKSLNNYGAIFILNSWSNSQVGLLTKTGVPKETGVEEYFVNNFIDSATIAVNGNQYASVPNDSVIKFVHRNRINHLINYYNNELKIIPQNTYNLIINIGNKNILTGTTTLPTEIEFTNITSDDKYFYINWKETDSLKSSWALRDTMEILSSESSFINFAKINKQFVKTNKEYELRVYTFDKNLTEYKSKQVARSGINKEFGVFGSITRSTLKVTFH